MNMGNDTASMESGMSTDGGGTPDLASTIEQLKASIAGLSAQVEQVAEAAGIAPSGTEGSPEEESTETPEAEGAEGGFPPEAPEAGAAVPYKKKPAGNVMSFLNGKK